MRRGVDPDGNRGADGGGDVIGEAVVADAFGAARGREDIDGEGAVGDCGDAEGDAMECADDGEEEKRASGDVADEEEGKDDEEEEKDLLAGEAVDQIAAEESSDERHDCIAEEDETDGILVGLESVAEVDGEQRGKEHEREENHKISNPHLGVVGIPEFFVLRVVVHCKKDQ